MKEGGRESEGGRRGSEGGREGGEGGIVLEREKSVQGRGGWRGEGNGNTIQLLYSGFISSQEKIFANR